MRSAPASNMENGRWPWAGVARPPCPARVLTSISERTMPDSLSANATAAMTSTLMVSLARRAEMPLDGGREAA